MPIKGLSDVRRLPRLGKVHLGIKVQHGDGWIPRPTDYFVCPPEVQAVYGEQPRELVVMFPTEDPDLWASQFYRCYSATHGLVCKGNGETARRLVDEDGNLANKRSKSVEWKDITCLGRACPETPKQCRRTMNLQFLLQDVEGLGVYQIDTSGYNSIVNINTAVDMIQAALGRIAMIPLTLRLVAKHVQTEAGDRHTVQSLYLDIPGRLIDLLPVGDVGVTPPELPTPDDEVPELLLPENQLDAWRDASPDDPVQAMTFEGFRALGMTERDVKDMLFAELGIPDDTYHDVHYVVKRLGDVQHQTLQLVMLGRLSEEV